MKKSESRRILIVAGEASGDAHGAKLVREIRARSPFPVEFFGAVSHHLRDAGVEEIVNADQLSVVGLPEIARALPMFLSAFRKLRRAAADRRADAAILIDFPEFNLKLATSLKKLGIRTVYYISPQIWAWRQYRLRSIKRDVDLLLTILPFEKDWYRQRGFDRVEYVGNPTVREVHPDRDRAAFCAAHGLDAARPVIALLPGSRHKEIVRILPELLKTAQLIRQSRPEAQFVIPLASTRSSAEVDEAFEFSGVPRNDLDLRVVRGETYDAVNAADAAAVTSGTATLETAIIGTPLAIVYKTSPFNYKLIRPLIDVEHFGLINLIAGERLVKEMIQDDFSPSSLAAEILRLLEPDVNLEIRNRLAEATAKLGAGGASANAADAIIAFLGGEPKNIGPQT